MVRLTLLFKPSTQPLFYSSFAPTRRTLWRADDQSADFGHVVHGEQNAFAPEVSLIF